MKQEKKEQKIELIEYINNNRSKINIRHICENVNIDYKQFIAGINSDTRRISVNALKRFVNMMNDEIKLKENIKLGLIYKSYFDLHLLFSSSEDIEISTIKTAVYKLEYLLNQHSDLLNQAESKFIMNEVEKTKEKYKMEGKHGKQKK
ncbi:hypothetical protein [Breznakia pachnodae]|uniref:Beta-galactosidase beta subunit n=1 Tax=Breznakia pachnodae TaxID=265178 RepID=A0ABU0E3V5_9FIRM|nr:hypothetical protein [Breznakia pachnodae]MDQ0361572.1 beta-galactosidase beta subunit [Breznakia pachnodae]